MTAIAFAATCLAANYTAAQGNRPTPKLPNIVLVHGAWADGSSWNEVIQRLKKAGYHASAVQLTLSSFTEDVERTRALRASQTGPTLLVAHSFGGAIITAFGIDAPNVIGLAYESAFAPDSGETMKALISQPPQPPGGSAIRPDSRGYLWLEPDGFVKSFAPDGPASAAHVMAATQKPVAASALLSETPSGVPAWKLLPGWYLVTTDDLKSPPDAQRFLAKRMRATVTSFAGIHASMVSHPDAVAAFIMKAAQAASSGATAGAHQ